MRKKIIYGCDSRGDGDKPYLTRWQLINSKLLGIYVHQFHRSDAEEHHDHPWSFVSLILWRGYLEETVLFYEDQVVPVLVGEAFLSTGEGWEYMGYGLGDTMNLRRPIIVTKRAYPGQLLFRKASHRHAVRLIAEKTAITLVIRGPYVREWGFFTCGGWQQWKEYFKERGC